MNWFDRYFRKEDCSVACGVYQVYNNGYPSSKLFRVLYVIVKSNHVSVATVSGSWCSWFSKGVTCKWTRWSIQPLAIESELTATSRSSILETKHEMSSRRTTVARLFLKRALVGNWQQRSHAPLTEMMTLGIIPTLCTILGKCNTLLEAVFPRLPIEWCVMAFQEKHPARSFKKSSARGSRIIEMTHWRTLLKAVVQKCFW